MHCIIATHSEHLTVNNRSRKWRDCHYVYGPTADDDVQEYDYTIYARSSWVTHIYIAW